MTTHSPKLVSCSLNEAQQRSHFMGILQNYEIEYFFSVHLNLRRRRQIAFILLPSLFFSVLSGCPEKNGLLWSIIELRNQLLQPNGNLIHSRK